MSFRSVFMAVVIAFALVLSAFLILDRSMLVQAIVREGGAAE